MHAIPYSRKLSSTCCADAGIRWVLKLSNVPSISKNAALIILAYSSPSSFSLASSHAISNSSMAA